MIRKVAIGIGVMVLIPMLVLLGLYFIPPGIESVPYDYITADPEFDLDSKVGLYATREGNTYQVTWGAKTGLQVNYFDSLRTNLKSIRLQAIDDSKFDTDGDTDVAEATFTYDKSGSISGLELNTSNTQLKLIKQDSSFYHQEEIAYVNQETRLTGLLLEPYANSKQIAIVFIHGSGVSDRNNFWYMHQADYLARQGYLVLLPDKRGCGKSLGEWHTASFMDFANDTESAIDYLTENKSSSFDKIGVLGLSQGGWISQLLNEKANSIDFIIDVVGSSTSPNEQVQFEILNEIQSSGVPPLLARPLSYIFAKRAKGKRKTWWEKNGEFDPIPLMSESTIPTLKIFAERDENVPVERSLERVKDLLREQPDLPLDVKIFNDSGHALISAETGWIRNDYLNYLNDWISSTAINNP